MVKALPKNLENLYLKSPKSQQKTMLEMRKRILEIIPSAEEVISYGMPAFKYRGTVVAGLLSNKNHVGFYPFSGSVLALFREDLKKFKYTKSALHVPVDKPLSKTLLNKLIKARISQCSVKQGKIKLEKYQELDGYWREIGIAAPARRGLVDNKIYTLVQLKKWSEKDFMKIHAMGQSAAKIIKAEMKRKKVQFK